MESESTTIHLVRHGHILNPDAVFHGRLPGFPLSERGEQEAAAAAAFLSDKPIVAIYTSPMLRTRQTARIIQDSLQPPPPLHVELLLHEIYSPFDGFPHKDMEARDWDFYSDVDPAFEQPATIVQRLQEFFRKMCQQHRGEHVVGVTHADPLAFIWMWVLDKPVTVENRKALRAFGLSDDYPATASISTFTFPSSDPDVRPQAQYVKPS